MLQNIKSFNFNTLSHTMMWENTLFRAEPPLILNPLCGIGPPPHFRGVRKTGINGSLALLRFLHIVLFIFAFMVPVFQEKTKQNKIGLKAAYSNKPGFKNLTGLRNSFSSISAIMILKEIENRPLESV